jgi:hypothetical protein
LAARIPLEGTAAGSIAAPITAAIARFGNMCFIFMHLTMIISKSRHFKAESNLLPFLSL